jgi:hypothetical protein
MRGASRSRLCLLLGLLAGACPSGKPKTPVSTAPGATLAAPFVAITSPKRHQGVNPRSQIDVAGVAYGPVKSVALTHDGSPVAVTGGKRWTATVTLHEGDNVLEVVAAGEGGVSARDALTVAHHPGSRLGALEHDPVALLVGDGPILLSVSHPGGTTPLEVVAVDDAGAPQGAPLATLADGGAAGDAAAGDELFSAQVALDTAAPRTHRLRVRDPADGALGEVVEISVFARPTAAELAELDQVEDDAARWLADEGWTAGGSDAAAKAVLSRLRADARVKWAELSEGGESLTFATTAGLPSFVLLKVPDRAAAAPSQSHFRLDDGAWPAHSRIGSNKVVLLAPFAWETPAAAPFVAQLFRSTYCPLFEPDVFADDQADLAAFRSGMRGRGVLFFLTHGSYGVIPPHTIPNPGSTPLQIAVMTTAEEFTLQARIAYLAEEMAGLIVGGRLAAGGKKYILVTTRFVERYARDNDGALVWLGSCDGLAEQSLAAAFMTSGASFLVGFMNPTGNYLEALGNTFFHGLLVEGLATWPAYVQALEEVGMYYGVGALGDPNLEVAGRCNGYTRAIYDQTGGGGFSFHNEFLSVDELERDGDHYYVTKTRETCATESRSREPVLGTRFLTTGSGSVSWEAAPGEDRPPKLLFLSDGRLDVRTEALTKPWMEEIHTSSAGLMEVEKTTCGSLGDVSFAVGTNAFVTDQEIKGSLTSQSGGARLTIEFRYRR